MIQTIPYDEFQTISTNLRDYFIDGNVAEFNDLKSAYPSLPIDLRGVSCHNRPLRQINLQYAILNKSDFRGCDLQGAQFQNSYLADSDFRSFAGFGETNILGTAFYGAIFEFNRGIERRITQLYGNTHPPLYDGRLYDVPYTFQGREHQRYSRAQFSHTDLSFTVGIDLSAVQSTGTGVAALFNSDQFFTGRADSDSFESIEDSALKEILPDNRFLSRLHPEAEHRLVGKKSWVLTGNYHGSRSFNIINTNPSVVIILNGFSSHGYIKTVGDIVTCRGSGMSEIQANGTIYRCSQLSRSLYDEMTFDDNIGDTWNIWAANGLEQRY